MSDLQKPNISNISFKHMDYLFPRNTKLNDLTKCNLIFGRNSSGKSSISRYIKKTYSKKYDVKIFNKDKSAKLTKKKYNLNALLLGKDSQEIDKKVHKCEINIRDKKNQLSHDKINYEKRNNAYIHDKNILDNWYKYNAKILKQKNLARFNKKGFKRLALNICNSKISYELPKNICDKYIHILQEPSKENLNTNTDLPNIHLLYIKKYINSLLYSITNYVNSNTYLIDKRKRFAINGMKLHKSGDTCAFCGNKITSKRLKKLEYISFSSMYNKIKLEIKNLYGVIYKEQDKLNKYNINISPNNFYFPYISKSKVIIGKIKKACKQYNDFFEHLLIFLSNNHSNISSLTNFKKIYPTISFKQLQKSINSLSANNNEYKDHNKDKLNQIRKKILYNKVTYTIHEFNLKNELNQYHEDIKKKNKARNNVQDLHNQIKEINDYEEQLLEGTKSTQLAAKRINIYLSRLGDKSFKLHYINKNKEEYYQIVDANNKPRDIHHLSSGELNLISFFYFYYSLSPENSNNNKRNIIIFDDPMDSNDDDFQCLMIDMLERLIYKIYNKENVPKYKRYQTDQLFIFTHNINFYINLMTDMGYTKLHAYHLDKYGDHTKILHIKKSNDDYHNEYQELWEFVIFLYHRNKPEYMLNPIRRIIETFTKFESIDKNKFYSKYTGAKKELNVNSHAISGFDTTPIRSPNEAMELLRTLFKRNHYLNHFRRYISKYNAQYKKLYNQ